MENALPKGMSNFIFVSATLTLISGCDLLNTPQASIQQKVITANSELNTLVETARLGAYTKKETFVDAGPMYGKIIANLKSAALSLAPTKPSQKPREELIKVVLACADRVVSLSEVHKRFGLATNRPYEIFTGDCQLAEIAIKEKI